MENKEKEQPRTCPYCCEPLDKDISQNEHNANCAHHPCLDCEENSEECLRCNKI